MQNLRRTVLLLMPVSALLASTLSAQGVTTAAIYGFVTGPDSAGIEEAMVTVTNASNGERWQVSTRPHGQYLVEYLSLGGPYTVEARAIGFSPTQLPGVMLSLGERRRVDLSLTPMVVELPELITTATVDPNLNAGRTGPAQTIDARLATGLPVPGRDFSQLTFISPQAVITGDLATSFAGQSDRLNGLQIDGTSNSDLGGINGLYQFGTAGASNGARTLSIEALRELQVLTAPFDARYGMFAGGLVNAVTRSGSNRWEGSISSYYQTEALTGKDSTGHRAEDFSNKELTITLAGPIVRDRAAFFLDASLQRAVQPQDLSIGTDTTGGADSVGTGIRRASAEHFRDILRNTYGVEAGAIEAAPYRTPAWNVFGKATFWPALNQRVEISHNHAHGSQEFGAGYNGTPIYGLSSAGFRNPGTVNGTRLTWTMTSGGFANELLLSRLATTDRCEPAANFSSVRVAVDAGVLRAGRPFRCGGVFADNTSWELTDNFSWFAGTHHLTLGTHGEVIHQAGNRRLFTPHGIWNFNSLDSLETGLPSRYRRDIDGAGQTRGTPSDFRVHQVGVYLQDQWMPISNLTVTAGLRFDVPFLPDAVPRNQLLLDSLGINSSRTPSGNLLWTPRLGFNFDVGGRGRTFLRGGAGLFSGRPIYLYFSDIYETANRQTLSLDCSGTDVPAFTLDLANQPTTCGSGGTAVPVSSYFNPSFRFPRNLRLSLGADVRLPWDLIGTVDLLYIKGVEELDVIDANLAVPTAAAAGEGGRVLYGSIDPTDGSATPDRRSIAFGQVRQMRNARGDRSISATVQLQKRWPGGSEVSLAYTRTDARDRMSAVCFNLECNLDWVPVDGTLNNRRLATSRFEAAHKVTFGGVMGLPAHFQLGLFYNGFTGIPHTYLVEGDPNADGLNFFGGNDPIYVPRNAADITLEDATQWPALDSLINATPCLRSQRGRLMRRNSCRDHWQTLLNARLSKLFPLPSGQSIELIADVFNLLNLFDRDWGVQRRMSVNGSADGGDTRLLALVGYDQANGRGRYDVLRVDPNARNNDATRWRLQFGARYTF
jgi:hypothetical protein